MRTLNDLNFNGQSLSALGVTVSQKNRYNAPERDIKEVEVPGRNGNYIIDNGRYKNVLVSYHINIEEEFERKAPLIRNFLLGVNGSNTYEYRILKDTYDPDEFRYAVYSGDIQYDVGELMRYGECDITFNCKPQRFNIEDFETPITIEGSGELYTTILSASEAWSRYKSYFSNTQVNPFKDSDNAFDWVEVVYHADSLQAICVESENLRKDVLGYYFIIDAIPATGGQFSAVGFSKDKGYVTHITSNHYFVVYMPLITGVKLFAADYNLFPDRKYVDIPEDQKNYFFINSLKSSTIHVPSLNSCFPIVEFEINNPTSGLICSIGNKGIYVDINSNTFDLMPTNKIVLDTDSMEMTCGGQNFNKYTFFDGDIQLDPGDNEVSIGACSSASIIRRWFDI